MGTGKWGRNGRWPEERSDWNNDTGRKTGCNSSMSSPCAEDCCKLTFYVSCLEKHLDCSVAARLDLMHSLYLKRTEKKNPMLIPTFDVFESFFFPQAVSAALQVPRKTPYSQVSLQPSLLPPSKMRTRCRSHAFIIMRQIWGQLINSIYMLLPKVGTPPPTDT